MTIIHVPPAGQSRFIVPAFVCINAKTAGDAASKAGDILIARNSADTDDTRMFLCENSATELLGENEPDPTDLSGNPAGVVQAELELLRSDNADMRDQVHRLREALKKLHDAASTLAEECNTNSYFADEHASEVEALADAERVLHEVHDLAQV